MIRFALSIAILALFVSSVEARQRVTYAHERCNIDWPCEGVTAHPRGERVVKAMGGFGTARKVYKPRVAAANPRHVVRENKRPVVGPVIEQTSARVAAQIVSHPPGCPSRAFCGCGAAVEVFGSPIRSLWLAANWLKFPRAEPAPGMVAARRGHVFVLRQHLGGRTWLAYDANSGRHLTRIHARSIAGYTIVNPRV